VLFCNFVCTVCICFIGVDGQFTVTIISNPAGTLLSGSSYDYPVLSSVTLTCMVNPSPPAGVTYQWNTGGCFTNGRITTPTCFPHSQTTQSVTVNNLLAHDAGIIICTVTIGGINYTSGPLILRISGIHMYIHKSVQLTISHCKANLWISISVQQKNSVYLCLYFIAVHIYTICIYKGLCVGGSQERKCSLNAIQAQVFYIR